MKMLVYCGLLALSLTFSDAQDDLTLIDAFDDKAYKIAKSTGVWHARDLPSPLREPERCGRWNTPSWICDPNGIISKEEGLY